MRAATREEAGIKRSSAQVYMADASSLRTASPCMAEMKEALGKPFGFPSVMFFKDGRWQTKVIGARNTEELSKWFGTSVFGKEGEARSSGAFSGDSANRH